MTRLALLFTLILLATPVQAVETALHSSTSHLYAYIMPEETMTDAKKAAEAHLCSSVEVAQGLVTFPVTVELYSWVRQGTTNAYSPSKLQATWLIKSCSQWRL